MGFEIVKPIGNEVTEEELLSSIGTKANEQDLTDHENSTTNVHGITDTSAMATKAYADSSASTAAANIVDSAPSTLDTLNELAAALNDDANFATTVTNSIAAKASLSGASFTGNVTVLSEDTSGTAGVRNVYHSTSAPSGGSDGDIWLVYS